MKKKNNKDNENLNIFYTKINGYDIVFDKNYLQEILEKLKTKKLAIIDFEAFRVYNNEIKNFPLINKNEYFKNVKTFPFCFTFAIFKFNKSKNNFELNKKSLTYYEIENKEKINNEILKKEWIKMGEKIKNLSEKWEINGFIVLGKQLEINILNVLNKLIRNYKIPKIEIDLWDFFAQKKNFSILSFNFKLKNLVNSFEKEVDKKIDSNDIAKISNYYFIRNEIINEKEKLEFFKNVKNHNKNDIKKAIWAMNLMKKINNQKNIDNYKKIIKTDQQEIKLF